MNNFYQEYKDLESLDQEKLKKLSQKDLNTYLILACGNGYLDKVKYLLTSPKLQIHADIHAEDDSPIVCASYHGYINIVKYLLSSSELKEHSNIHAQDDFAFRTACDSEKIETIQYYIFDLNIEKSIFIEKHLNERNGHFIEKVKYMFKVRELSEQLESKKSSEKDITKRVKL